MFENTKTNFAETLMSNPITFLNFDMKIIPNNTGKTCFYPHNYNPYYKMEYDNSNTSLTNGAVSLTNGAKVDFNFNLSELQNPYKFNQVKGFDLITDINSFKSTTGKLHQESNYTEHTVTFQEIGGTNKYFINNIQQPTLQVFRNQETCFDFSSASGHPFKLSTTSDGTHSSGSEYTDGRIYYDDSSYYKNVIKITDTNINQLFYYCGAHSGMGGEINIVDLPASNNIYPTSGTPKSKIPNIFKITQTVPGSDYFTKNLTATFIITNSSNNAQSSFKDHKAIKIKVTLNKKVTPLVPYLYFTNPTDLFSSINPISHDSINETNIYDPVYTYTITTTNRQSYPTDIKNIVCKLTTINKDIDFKNIFNQSVVYQNNSNKFNISDDIAPPTSLSTEYVKNGIATTGNQLKLTFSEPVYKTAAGNSATDLTRVPLDLTYLSNNITLTNDNPNNIENYNGAQLATNAFTALTIQGNNEIFILDINYDKLIDILWETKISLFVILLQ